MLKWASYPPECKPMTAAPTLCCMIPNRGPQVIKFGWLTFAFWLATAAAAEVASFHDIQLPSAKGSLTNAALAFNDDRKQVEVKVSDGREFKISYAQIDKISYEYTKKHRIKQGVGIAMLSPLTGGVVALTKSKNHWLEFDFHDQSTAKMLIVKLDKRDYQKVCEAAKSHVGKDVETLGKTDTESIKAKLK
jgi:hypothetical protein